MNSAGLNSICLRSLIKGKSAFPASSVTVREGSIIPRNKQQQKKFGISHHQFGHRKGEQPFRHNIPVSASAGQSLKSNNRGKVLSPEL